MTPAEVRDRIAQDVTDALAGLPVDVATDPVVIPPHISAGLPVALVDHPTITFTTFHQWDIECDVWILAGSDDDTEALAQIGDVVAALADMAESARPITWTTSTGRATPGYNVHITDTIDL